MFFGIENFVAGLQKKQCVALSRYSFPYVWPAYSRDKGLQPISSKPRDKEWVDEG